MLLCIRLIRYLHPTDEELRELAGIPKDMGGKGKSKGKNQDFKNPNTFHVPKDLDIKVLSLTTDNLSDTVLTLLCTFYVLAMLHFEAYLKFLYFVH